MNYIIFKYKKKSLNLRITEDADKESLINTIRYCIKYINASKSRITLREVKKWLEDDTEKCSNPIIEESLVIDLKNIDKNLFNNIDDNLIDEELVGMFNEYISNKKYIFHTEIILMLLVGVILKTVDYMPIDKSERTILLILLGCVAVWQLYKQRYIVSEVSKDVKNLANTFKKKEITE